MNAAIQWDHQFLGDKPLKNLIVAQLLKMSPAKYQTGVHRRGLVLRFMNPHINASGLIVQHVFYYYSPVEAQVFQVAFSLIFLSIHFVRLVSMLHAHLAREFITVMCTAGCINEVKEAGT